MRNGTGSAPIADRGVFRRQSEQLGRTPAQKPGDIAISLGHQRGYTVFGFLAALGPSASDGHIFANPVDPVAYMALVCCKNARLTREHVRNELRAGRGRRFVGLCREPRSGMTET